VNACRFETLARGGADVFVPALGLLQRMRGRGRPCSSITRWGDTDLGFLSFGRLTNLDLS
jgi:hypothetical protein